MENKPDELFSIRLNKTGIASIRLLARLINVVLILSLISCAAVIFYHVYTYAEYSGKDMDPYIDDDPWLAFQYRYSYWIYYGYIAIWLLQLIFLWKFVRGIGRGLGQMNEVLFNQSFRKLIIALVLTVAAEIINTLLHFVMIRNLLYAF